MDKSVIFNILALFLLIVGIVSIVVATIKPIKLIKLDKVKLNGRVYIIKDKHGFIKYNQKMYWGLGIMCSVISILSLLKIIEYSTCFIGTGFIISIVALANSISIKKYA